MRLLRRSHSESGSKDGSEQSDLTTGPVSKLMVKMAVPASIGYFFNTMYNLVDTYFGGKISTTGLAALSLSFPVFIVVLAIGVGLSSGASSLIANALGARDREKAIRYQAQAISFGGIVAVASVVVMFLVLAPVFRLMNAEGETLAAALRYARVLVPGGIFFIMNYVLNAGLTARGDTKTYRNFLIAGFVLNIGLDPLFLFGLTIGGATLIPAMGEGGIALATVLIQVLGTFYIVRRVFRSGGFEGMHLKDFLPQRRYYADLTQQSLPASLNMLTMALGVFVITYFVSRFGTDAVAAYGAAIRIEQVALVPTVGLNTALATLVGQNNGAGRLDRVLDSYRKSLLYGLYIMIGVLTPVLLFARPIMRQFTTNPEVFSMGLAYLYIQAFTFYSYIVLYQSSSVMQGLKKPAMIMWTGLYRQIVAPLIFFPLFTVAFAMGVTGIWGALVVVNWTAALFIFAYAMRTLKKKLQTDRGILAILFGQDLLTPSSPLAPEPLPEA